jgi:hypothetical protein
VNWKAIFELWHNARGCEEVDGCVCVEDRRGKVLTKRRRGKMTALCDPQKRVLSAALNRAVLGRAACSVGKGRGLVYLTDCWVVVTPLGVYHLTIAN